MVKWFILFTTLLIAGCSTAPPIKNVSGQSVFFPAENKMIYFPPCTDASGLKVQWLGVPAETLREFDAIVIVATRANDGSVARIMYDRKSFPQVWDEWIRWLQYHECAHHTLGHMLPDYPPTTMQDEWDADCIATKTLREEGVSWSIVYLYARVFLKARSDTHGDIDDRLNSMQQCYNAGIAQLVEQRLGKA